MPAEIPKGAFIVARVILNSSLWTMRIEDRIVAITCIALCNWQDANWFDGQKNIPISRGQFVRSRDELAKSCNISVQKLRTSIKHLEKVVFLTRKTTKMYTLYTLPRYDFYQVLSNYEDTGNPKPNQQLTSNQPAPNQHLTSAQPAPNQKQVIQEGKERKEGEETVPLNGSEIEWEKLRMEAARIRTLFLCPQSVDKCMTDIEAAMIRSGCCLEDVRDRANKGHEKYRGQDIWFFTDTEWPKMRASAQKPKETREERLKRLSG